MFRKPFVQTDTDVLIIGAGPAGLTAGYLLSKRGRDVMVLEKDPVYVGGISRTVNYKGYLFDIGDLAHGHRPGLEPLENQRARLAREGQKLAAWVRHCLQ